MTKIMLVVGILACIDIGISGYTWLATSAKQAQIRDITKQNSREALTKDIRYHFININRTAYRYALSTDTNEQILLRNNIATAIETIQTLKNEHDEIISEKGRAIRAQLDPVIDNYIAVIKTVINPNNRTGRANATAKLVDAEYAFYQPAANLIHDLTMLNIAGTDSILSVFANDITRFKLNLILANGLGLMIGLAAAYAVARHSITKPFQTLSQQIHDLANGNEQPIAIDPNRKDEIGIMQRALSALRDVSVEAFATKQMVDTMPLAVMTADPQDNFKIKYVNKSGVDIIQPVEHVLPVKAHELIGKSIDIFHKNPAHQRAILNDPSRLPLKGRIEIGGQAFALGVSAIRNRMGDYVGPMVTWQNITHMARMANDFETNVGGVSHIVSSAVTELQATAQTLSSMAEETQAQAVIVTNAAEQASVNVGTVASSTEELSASVGEIRRRVHESAEIAQAARQQAQQTNLTVEKLQDAAEKIGEIVELISNIARQTNLLALNATIEAARAGEAGKGFIVVASEVKTLAAETAKATNEISTQINAMQSITNESVNSIHAIGNTIEQLHALAGDVASAVEQQAIATQEIARSVEMASEGTREVSRNMVAVREAATETGRAASQLLDTSSELNEQAANLQNEVGNFLITIRS